MPRNPRAPPYRSKHVISKSKTTEKYMTTIPKPVISSLWKTWNIEKEENNTLKWTPSGYEGILKHLTDNWKLTYSDAFKNIEKMERVLLFVSYDIKKNVEEKDAWTITSRTTSLENQTRFSWSYNPEDPEYLINVLTYSLKENLLEAQFGKNYTEEDIEEFDVLYATVSLDLAKINPTYWASLLKMKEIIETAVITIVGNIGN